MLEALMLMEVWEKDAGLEKKKLRSNNCYMMVDMHVATDLHDLGDDDVFAYYYASYCCTRKERRRITAASRSRTDLKVTMEGVGARLGRSSTRYGPTTVFSGPVRKWKKRWVHVNPLSNHNSFHSHHHNATTNAAAAASSSATNHSSSSNAEKQHGDRLVEIYRERELGTVEVADNAYQKLVDLIERQKKETEEQEEASEKIDDESKPSDTDPHAAEPVSKSDSADEKPDINDVPMEESQDGNQVVRQDLNESTLDLSLGLVS
ncbi:hypothetical protein DKX38_005302 [Salix brachista]|uniref:Uncharacterized protein n=1 Tax=Salix brachista TaxID=2182728 RepID=A0A5N5MZ96_9ROSI|nr:hypothetical protein DKX38_005302 [Salix brachista]